MHRHWVLVFFCTPYWQRLTRLLEKKKQDNGGRKPRRILCDDNGDMDLHKVVDWVVHQRLESVYQNNEPTGLMKQRKVWTLITSSISYTNACTMCLGMCV